VPAKQQISQVPEILLKSLNLQESDITHISENSTDWLVEVRYLNSSVFNMLF